MFFVLAVAMTMLTQPATRAEDPGPAASVERRIDIDGLMKAHHVPGLSIAVVDDYRIAWAKGYGVTEAGGQQPVTTATLFLAGSISKPVAAVGALALVEARRLSLDADIRDALKSWRLPADSFRTHQLTLHQLLDHTAGFSGGEFFPGYAITDKLPTLAQILNGQPPATNPPARLASPPGQEWRYSGDGYLVLQQLMVDATDTPFPDLMQRLVFDKIGMASSTFRQPLPADLAPLAAAGSRIDGTATPGRWRVSPELAAAGLWSTPTDLAKLAIEIALSVHGKANHVLSRETAVAMLAPHVRQGVMNVLGTPDDPDAMGYGFFVGPKTGRFGHVGGHTGYQATFVMFADSGRGAIIMSNGDRGIADVGNRLLNAIAAEYRWNYAAPAPP